MNPYIQPYYGCDPSRPWCYDSSQSSTAFSSRNRGFSHRAIDHVLPANKTTGSLSRSSSTMEKKSLNTSPEFFLRPYLTREEYAYWNSHFRQLRSSVSCSCSCSCASNPRDNTTVTYQHREPSVCARNATGFPFCGRKPPFGDPPVRGSSTSEGLCGNSGFVPKPCVPEKNASSTNYGIRRTKANALGCHYPTNTSPNLKDASECVFRGKRFVETPSCPKRSGPPTRHIESNHPSRSPNSSAGGHQESAAAELRKRISERYLCGDKSFEESPSALVSPTRQENSQTGSTDLCGSTSAYGAHPELSSADSCPVKRKSTSVLSENGRYPQRKCKRQYVGDDVNGIHDAQASNKTVDLNDTLRNFLNGPLQTSSCYGKDAINESSGTRRSRAMTGSRGMTKTRVQGRSNARRNISAITSGSRCENNNVKKPGSESVTRALPLIDLTDCIADATVKSRVLQGWHQAPNDANKARLERKDIGEVFKTAKPVQRKLLKNSRSSLGGSYALDYDSLPKLISVLSSSMAKVASTLL